MENGKTIKQLADELGVSKQAVRDKIAKLGLHSTLQRKGNQLCILKSQENLIRSAFKTSNVQSKNANILCENSSESQTTLHLISMLQNELNIKNKQIDSLNARLAESNAALVSAQQTAQAAQALHAGTIKKQLEEQNTDSEDGTHTQSEKKQSILSRLFRKEEKKKDN